MPLPALPFRLTRPAPHPGVAEAMLRLMEDDETPWDALATHAMRDAALSLALLWMSPLTGDEATRLKDALAERLQRAGRPLLRAWLLHAGTQQANAETIQHLNQRALMSAECALHLAIEHRYSRPDEAYLAGLWQALGSMSLLASSADYAQLRDETTDPAELRRRERQRFGDDHIALAAVLGQHCGLPPLVLDAIALSGALEEQIASAHPLAALLRAALSLSAPVPRFDEAARLTGMTPETLTSLQTDVGYLSSQGLQEIGIGLPVERDARSLAPGASYPSLPPRWRKLALSGLLGSAFEGAADAAPEQQLARAFRLLFGKTAPLMLHATHDRVRPLAHAGRPAIDTLLGELGLRIDDETSVIALALRTATSTSHFPGRDGPGRSTRDWHVTRWLGGAGILCLPWEAQGVRGVAVLGIDESLDITPDEQQLMSTLVASAAQALVRAERQATHEAHRVEATRADFIDKARRVTHEINSPLTVIKSYLGIIAQREAADAALTGELTQVGKEIDRVSTLLKKMTEAEPDPGEDVNSASVNEVARSLERVYGNTLFGSRKRDLEIRLPAALPAVAMPASALKQVLLNLMRNAAEALPEGCRLSITSPGVLIANGTPSVEIRMIDNGPGLPEARLARLFAPAPSTKGDAHQGLGLSIVKDILSQWQAYILCRSQANVGTSFQLFIPLDQAP
ncbi:MAG: HDOD domain-containing protein [Rhodocyclaceae bacterium]|nr:HDOD domain-containing protein [Rhodocyclaceae bacterium]